MKPIMCAVAVLAFGLSAQAVAGSQPSVGMFPGGQPDWPNLGRDEQGASGGERWAAPLRFAEYEVQRGLFPAIYTVGGQAWSRDYRPLDEGGAAVAPSIVVARPALFFF
ncbi:hypothetical protein SAMN04244573_01053 [Azotobacter beijerinckii]|uniref:Uncharacterized protein n=1 Tax=Azotobacter beijerinckii TaxID=170623 RepID=A0A1H9DKU7_9GAMM|nr:hypothetical protein [Azotobacter beijerinckii]SEQ13937.1 hypothetical protein SAMN04244573_01053 [Azotobacter beijerinckii]